MNLELHVVRELALAQAKGGTEILAEEGSLVDDFQESLVNSLLVSNLAFGKSIVLLFSTLKELFVLLDGLLGKVGIVDLLIHLNVQQHLRYIFSLSADNSLIAP